MKPGTHHIRSQRWQISTTSTPTAFTLRQELRTQLDTLLLPAFERAFDAMAPDDEVLHIPSLMLRLQLRDGKNLTAELARLIEEELHTALRAVVRNSTTKFDAQTRSAVVGTLATPHGAQALSAAEHRRALLLQYLASGRIGWQAEPQEASSLLAWLKAEAELLATQFQEVERIVAGSLETRLAVSFRLLQLLTPSTRETLLLQDISGRTAEPIPIRRQSAGASSYADQMATSRNAGMISILCQLATQQALGSFLQLRVAAMLLTLRGADLSLSDAGIVEQLLGDCSAKLAGGNMTDATLLRTIDSLLGRTVFDSAAPENQEAPPGRIPSASANALAQEATHQCGSETITGINLGRSSSSPPDDVVGRIMHLEPAAASQAPGLLVGDAGIILLHPFLQRLFESTGIAAATSRSLPVVQLPRAAALLHWIATGREEVFEFELSFIKVLIGLTPNDPLLIAGGLLNDNDRAEGQALLAAVIEHWTALRNTSVAGLRVSFLQRRGLLRADDRGWWLRVEAESFDMLLSQLPWGISFVKLPWMTKPIFTDWPTP